MVAHHHTVGWRSGLERRSDYALDLIIALLYFLDPPSHPAPPHACGVAGFWQHAAASSSNDCHVMAVSAARFVAHFWVVQPSAGHVPFARYGPSDVGPVAVISVSSVTATQYGVLAAIVSMLLCSLVQ